MQIKMYVQTSRCMFKDTFFDLNIGWGTSSEIVACVRGSMSDGPVCGGHHMVSKYHEICSRIVAACMI